MAETPVIVVLGSSNEAGFLALLDDVPIDDLTRWLGAGALHPPQHSGSGLAHPPTEHAASFERPYEVRVPGIRLLTPNRPSSTNVSRAIAGVAGGKGTIDYSGDPVPIVADSWLYIRTSTSAQGKLRRVLSQADASCGSWLFYRGALLGGGGGDGSHRVVIDESFCPTISCGVWPFYRDAALGGGTGLDRALSESLSQDEFGSWGTVTFLLDSYTVDSVDVSRKTIRKTATAAAFTAAVQDRDVLFFADNSVRRIKSWTFDTITVDRPVGAALAGGFCILTGSDACMTLADLASTNKTRLQDLTFYIDEKAPVFLKSLSGDGGNDVCNYDATPFQNPRIAHDAGPTINSVPELGFHIRSEVMRPIVVVQLGISASMISPFLQGAIPAGPPPFSGFVGWFHDIRSLDFSPTSPDALFVALTNQITAARLHIEAEGDTAKFVGIFVNLFDNDPVDGQRIIRIGANAEMLIDALREHIGDDEVPCVLSGPSRYGGSAEGRALIYAQLQEVTTTRKAVGVLDTRMTTEISGGVFVYPDDYAPDDLHFSASGQIKKARGYFGTWKTVLARVAAAAVPVPADTSPAAIIARIDAAILDGVDVLSFPGNGGQITLRGFDEMMRMREKMVALAARQNRMPRKTLARFQ